MSALPAAIPIFLVLTPMLVAHLPAASAGRTLSACLACAAAGVAVLALAGGGR